MDYMAKIKESVNFTMKHKILWVFGFFVALMSGGNSMSNFNQFIGEEDQAKLDTLISGIPVWAIILFSLSWLILLIILWYLANLSRSAIIYNVVEDEKGEALDSLSFKQVWNDGKKNVGKFLKLDIILLAIVLLISIPLILSVLSVLVSPFLIILLCISVIVYIVVIILLAVVVNLAKYFVIIKGYSVRRSIKYAWKSFKNNFTDYFLAAIVRLLPSCLWQIITFIPMLLLMIAGLVIFYVALNQSPLFFLVLIGVAFLIYIIISAFLMAPYNVFSNTYWTKIIYEIDSEEK